MQPPGPPETTVPSAPADDLVGSRSAGPKALRGSAMLGVGYAVSIALSLVSVPLLIRHLGFAQFGRYTTVIGLVTIATGLTDAGLANISLREWSTLRGEARRTMMASLLGIRLALNGVAVAAAVGFALVAGYDHVEVLGTLVAGVGMSLQPICDVFTVSLQGDLRFGWISIIDIARQALSVALIVTFVLIGAGVLAFWAITVPAGLLVLLFTVLLVRGRMPLRPRWRGARWWPLVRDTLPYSAAIALNTLYFRVTLVVMSLRASSLQTGYFATSFRVTEVLVGVPALAIGAAFPILSRSAHDDPDRFTSAASRIVELAVAIGVPVVLGVVLCAPFIVDVLGGRAGAPASPVLQIQGLALLSTFVSVACGFILLAQRRHGLLLVANAAALATNVVLTLVLVPLLAARGAAIAAVAAETCLAGAQLAMVLRITPARPSLASFAVPALGGALGAAPLLIGGLYPLLRGVIGVAVYIAVLAIFRRIPPELRHALQRDPDPSASLPPR